MTGLPVHTWPVPRNQSLSARSTGVPRQGRPRAGPATRTGTASACRGGHTLESRVSRTEPETAGRGIRAGVGVGARLGGVGVCRMGTGDIPRLRLGLEVRIGRGTAGSPVEEEDAGGTAVLHTLAGQSMPVGHTGRTLLAFRLATGKNCWCCRCWSWRWASGAWICAVGSHTVCAQDTLVANMEKAATFQTPNRLRCWSWRTESLSAWRNWEQEYGSGSRAHWHRLGWHTKQASRMWWMDPERRRVWLVRHASFGGAYWALRASTLPECANRNGGDSWDHD